MKVLLLTLALVFAQSQTTAATDENRELPIHIDAGTSRYEPGKDDEPGKIVFSKDVEVKQGSATASADVLTALVDAVTRQISSAVAEGNVRVKEANRIAVANRAEFVRADNTIVLTGAARLWDKGNLVEGKKIVFYLESGTVDCHECTLILDPDEIDKTLDTMPEKKSKSKGKDSESGSR